MKLPLQIAFRGMPPSDAIKARIEEKAAKLDEFYDRIMACRVIVEAPHRRHHQGKLYHVRVDLTVPEGEMVVSREPHEHHAHEDVYVAIRDAFDAAKRRLEDHARRERGKVKRHEEPAGGRVARLFPDYGFIETPDGREIYFHRNSVLKEGFGRLAVGTAVRFVEEAGERGPQASTVTACD
jgi:ribosomal subunit interface protein